jgi:uncharacterized membrane protein YoaK (UPF0700 family)
VALIGFLVGAAVTGAGLRRFAPNRPVLLRTAAVIECALVAVALLVAVVAGEPFDEVPRVVIAGLIAAAMGIQNTVVRHLAVPDLTTTVLTLTMVGLAADRPTDNRGSRLIRRLLAVVALLLGAVVGAEIVLHGNVASALLVTVALLAAVAIGAAASVRSTGSWRR